MGLHVGVVENVKELGAELIGRSFSEQIVVLEDRKIKVLQARTAYLVASEVPKRTGYRVGEAIHVEVVVPIAGVDRALRRRRIATRCRRAEIGSLRDVHTGRSEE